MMMIIAKRKYYNNNNNKSTNVFIILIMSGSSDFSVFLRMSVPFYILKSGFLVFYMSTSYFYQKNY